MKLNSKVVGIILIILIFGGISFVAFYNGLPYDMSEDIYLPQSAVEILKSKGNLNNEQIKYLQNHTINIINQPEENVTGKSNITQSATDRIVKGKTTFKEIIDWGISKEEIEAILSKKIQNTAITLNDYCSENNIDFSTIKSELQNKLDSLK